MFWLNKEQKKWWDFMIAMTEREIKSRYKMAVFGFLWVFLNPLLQMLILGFIFQFFVAIKTVNYFEFLFSGLLVWNFFSYTVGKNTPMYINERTLIQKAKFPREAVVLSIVFSDLFHFLISLVLFLGWMLLVHGLGTWLRWLILPVVIIWLTALTSGLSLLFSSLDVKWRDINFGVQAIMPLWFYASPVVYTLDLLPKWMRNVINLNPMTGILETFRWAIFGMPLDWQAVIISLGGTLIIFGMGLLVFKKESPFFDDWI
jgi:ABC-type polysaccharide/polyol phosphate export permease